MHKGVRRQKQHLPYCPTLGVHHMFYEGRHYTRHYEKTLRNFGEFILGTDIAPPPQHTLIHRSLAEPPRPSNEQAYDLIIAAKHGGLFFAVEELDNRVTNHLRQQLAILAIPTDEAIDRLTRKTYVTQHELMRMC